MNSYGIIKNLVTSFYKMGIYTNDDVASFVNWGNITEQDYQEITGAPYVKNN